jgi:hypothetical protein
MTTLDDIYEELAEDENVLIRLDIANAYDLPESIQLKLCYDQHPLVRLALARNRMLFVAAQLLLIATCQHDLLVLRELARNPYLCKEAKKTLLSLKDMRISWILREKND